MRDHAVATQATDELRWAASVLAPRIRCVITMYALNSVAHRES